MDSVTINTDVESKTGTGYTVTLQETKEDGNVEEQQQRQQRQDRPKFEVCLANCSSLLMFVG